jgi:N-formylglutamate amidohydrolase
MSRFEVLRASENARLPLLVHVPHSSTSVPAEYRADFVVSDAELESELLTMTDRYTDELAEAATDASLELVLRQSLVRGSGEPRAEQPPSRAQSLHRMATRRIAH